MFFDPRIRLRRAAQIGWPILKAIIYRLDVWATYIAFLGVGSLGWIFYNVLNRTTVVGRENIPKLRQFVIFVVNHLSFWDAFLVGISGFFPWSIIYPAWPPYNLAAEENFKRFLPLAIMLHFLKTKFVRKGRKDPQLFFRLNRLLSKHNILIFYQGGRRPPDDLRGFQANSISYLVSERLMKGEPIYVVPVYHRGLEKMFGGIPGTQSLKNWLPRTVTSWLFRRLTVRFGKPIDFTDVAGLPIRKQWEIIKNRIVERIEELAHETS